MNILLDTHIALWAITNDPKLPEHAHKTLLSPRTRLYVSVASLWEIGIKHRKNPKNMPIPAVEAQDYFEQSGFELLSIRAHHVLEESNLTDIHKDPFDRILIAQAISEPMYLMTHDANILQYPKVLTIEA